MNPAIGAVVRVLKGQIFLFLIVAIIAIAWLIPSLGLAPWAPTVRDVAVIGIFFFSGLTLPSSAVGRALISWRTHLVIQGVSFVLAPLMMWSLVRLLPLDALLAQGLLIAMCVPTTVTSCVVFTRLSGGNEAAALCAAALGNIAGIVITPLLLWWLVGLHGQVDALAVILRLIGLVALPVAVGQICRLFAQEFIDALKPWPNRLVQTCLLWIIYTVFAQVWTDGTDLGWGDVAVLSVVTILAHILLMAASWVLGGVVGLDAADKRAAIFCGSEKTVAAGIPLVGALYAGDPRLAILLLPLILFHALQLPIDAFAAQVLGGRRDPV